MKLIFLLGLVACANSAKLDRTYLPPHAQTSGGSANILDTPNYEPSPFQAAAPQGNFGQRNRGQETQANFGAPHGIAQNDPASRGQAAPQGNFAQAVSNFAQSGPALRGQAAPQGNYAQDPNNFASGPAVRGQNAPQNNYAQPNQGNFAQNGNNFASEPAANVPFNPLAETTFANEGSGFAPSNIAQPNFANDDSVAIDNFEASPGNFESNPGNFEAGNFDTNSGSSFERPERPRASLDRNAAILRMDSSNDGETYAYAYETDNGIAADESGVATNGVEAQGGFSYTGDDGQVYSIRYTADQNGFVPVGDHLPTPPPVPEEILKALEKNARDEANGIFDDGSYNAEKYGTANEQPNQQQFGNNDYPTDNLNNIANENPNTGNFASPGNFAQDSGNFSPDSGNFAPSNNFDQAAIAPEDQGLNKNGNTEAFSSNFANKTPSNIAQEDEDTVVTNSAAEFPSFANQRSQPSTGSGGSKGPAYLPPRDQTAGAKSNDLQGPSDAGFGQKFGSANRSPSFNGRSGYRI